MDEKKRQDVPYMKFVDYKTGKVYPNEDFISTEEFWKPISEVVKDYTEHKESKSDGNIGGLKRKHLLINKFSIRYIGKESNEVLWRSSEIGKGFQVCHYFNSFCGQL